MAKPSVMEQGIPLIRPILEQDHRHHNGGSSKYTQRVRAINALEPKGP